jgi:sugar lactone lactonase YvrE
MWEDTMMKTWTLFLITLLAFAPAASGRDLPREQTVGDLEVVATFNGPTPTGVAVSHTGRVFLNFPRWGEPVDFTVAELVKGKVVAYPDAVFNRLSPEHPEQSLLSVQSVVIDPRDRLWILDTGAPSFGPVQPQAAKLVGVDLRTNQIFKTIFFPADVALKTTYLNDVRFDLTRGPEGMAFITDSSGGGPNAIIVVDLASGRSWRRLNDHPSTKADKTFVPIIEGEPVMIRIPGQAPKPWTSGADGIAISPDGKTLYYCPLVSRHLYSVSVDALADPSRSDAEVAATVKDLGDKGASDGLEADDQGRIYIGDYEHNAIRRRNLDGSTELLVVDPRVLWPDTLSLAANGYLYFTANQLTRGARFHFGKDLRQRPFVLFRVKTDGKPIMQ